MGATEQPALVRWNTNSLQWDVLALVSNGTNGLAPSLGGSGSYALVVPDTGLLSPPAAQPGQPLQGSSPAPPDFAVIQASGTVTPQSSPASTVAQQVTALAHVIFTNTAGNPLASGLALHCQVSEQYQMRDGLTRVLPRYDRFIVAYQRPGDAFASTLEANFPMRPVLLLGADVLAQATVQVDVYAPAPFSGGLLSDAGGSITSGSVGVSAAAGDVSSQQLSQLRELDLTNFASFSSNGVVVVKAFDLTVAGIVPGRHLAVSFSSLPTNGLFVLASVVCQNGWYGLQPLERLFSDTNGVLSSLEPSTGDRLPGITGSGQYLLVQVSAPEALISGVAQNSAGVPAGGLPVRIAGQPWLTFSGANGSFQLLSPLGTASVATTDPVSGNSGQSTVAVTNVLNTAAVNVAASTAGPSVALVTPADGATSVPLVSLIVVQFSKPLNPGTVGTNGVVLVDTNGQPVAASLSLNLNNTIATLLPTSQLGASALLTIVVSNNITDAAGLPITGQTTFSFTTASDLLNRNPNAQLISYEPTNGVSQVVGTPGIAEPNAPVILVNETSGRAATVTAGPDGSFTNTIMADVDDVLSAVMVNHNGTRNTVYLSQQIFSDGSVGLFSAGGTIAAQTPSGPLQLTIEPGAISGKSKLKLDYLTLDQVQTVASNTPPEGGASVIGGFHVSMNGPALSVGAHVSFPIKESDLNLAPGDSASNHVFAMCAPVAVNGSTVYRVLDSMAYEGGAVVSHSPPFDGLADIPGAGLVISVVMCSFNSAMKATVVGQVVVACESMYQSVWDNGPATPILAKDPRVWPLANAWVNAFGGMSDVYFIRV